MTRLRQGSGGAGPGRQGSGGAGTFSGSRFGGWYFLVQALGSAAWWVYLSAEPSAVPLFLPRGAAEADLRAFQLPDLLAFSSLGLASGLTMAGRGAGTPLPFVATNRLVTTGPYSYLRNPMVVAGLGPGRCGWAVVRLVGSAGLCGRRRAYLGVPGPTGRGTRSSSRLWR